MARRLTQDEILALSSIAKRNVPEPKFVSSRMNIAPGEGTKKKARAGTGIANLVFDIMDQPRAAIAETIHAGIDKDETTDPLSGFFKGLTGKVHTPSSQIVEDLGITNPVAKGLLGFAGDVALDPLTYVGAKRIKGKTPGVARIEAMQQATRDVERGVISPQIFNEHVEQLAAQSLGESPYKVGVQVRVPGVRGSRRDFMMNEPPVVQKLRTAIMGPEGQERGAAKAFSRAAEQPYDMDKLNREIEASMAGRMQDAQYSLKRIANAVTTKDNEIAALAAEDPNLFEQVKDNVLVASKVRRNKTLEQSGIKTMGDYVTFMRDAMHKASRAEMEAGGGRSYLPTEDRIVMVDGRREVIPTQLEWHDLSEAEQQKIITEREQYIHKRVENPQELERVPGLAKYAGKPGVSYINPNQVSFTELLPNKRVGVIAHLGQSAIDRVATSYRNQIQLNITHKALQDLGINAATPEGREIMENMVRNPENQIRWKPVQPKRGENTVANQAASHTGYKDFFIPEPIARMLNEAEKVYTNPDIGRQFLQYADRGMGHWKAINTVFSPGYFARNTLGDVMQNFSNGVWNIKTYIDAHRVLSEVRKTQIEDFASAIRDPNASLNTPLRPGGISDSEFRVRIGGQKKTPGEIYDKYIQHGVPSGEIVTERQRGLTAVTDPITSDVDTRLKVANLRRGAKDTLGAGAKTAWDNVVNLEAAASDANIWRENRLRMTNFIHTWDDYTLVELQNEAKKNHWNSKDIQGIREKLGPEALAKLEDETAKRAAGRVRDINIDYGALTAAEKKYMKRVMPFYTFMRKNTPLQLSMLLTNPGYMSLLPKAVTMIQNLLGTDDPSGDFQVPRWIRESMPIRLAVGGQEGGFAQKLARFASGSTDDNSVFLPLFPSLVPQSDIQQVLQPLQRTMETGSFNEGFEEAARTVANMTNPVVKGLYEKATGRSVFTGGELGDWKEWLISQGLGAPGRTISSGVGMGEKPVVPSFVSFMGGPRPQNVSQERQKSEFRRRADIIQPRIDALRAEIAKARGIDKESKRYSKIKSPEIKALSQYLKYQGRAVGSYGSEP